MKGGCEGKEGRRERKVRWRCLLSCRVDANVCDPLPLAGAVEGLVIHGAPLGGRLPLVSSKPYSESHGVLYRNNKEGQAIFNMLVKRSFDAGLRIESRLITVRSLLIAATDLCRRAGLVGLDQITVWTCARYRPPPPPPTPQPRGQCPPRVQAEPSVILPSVIQAQTARRALRVPAQLRVGGAAAGGRRARRGDGGHLGPRAPHRLHRADLPGSPQ